MIPTYKILIDSDLIIALIKKDDNNHLKAIKIFKKYANAEIFVSPFCISEVATVLSLRVSQQAAITFIKNFRERNITELAFDRLTAAKADAIFCEQSIKGTSWIDCCNVAYYRLQGFDAIASFDKFYNKVKVKVLI